MNNLKPGCMAIVIKNVFKENIGKIVKCVKFIGEDPHRYRCYDVWEVDQLMKCIDGIDRNLTHGYNLQRIDNEDETEEIKKELEIDA